MPWLEMMLHLIAQHHAERQNTAAGSEVAEAAKLKRGKPSLKRRKRKKRERKVGACDQISACGFDLKLSFLNRYSAGMSTPTIPPFFSS
jgi:hypothetical protein